MFELECPIWLPEVRAVLKQQTANMDGVKRRSNLQPAPTNTQSMCVPNAQGSSLERVAAFFIGGAPRLRAEEVVHSPGDRFRLQTLAGGTVHVRLGESVQRVRVHACAAGLAGLLSPCPLLFSNRPISFFFQPPPAPTRRDHEGICQQRRGDWMIDP
jgi:hypothetical protein